MTEPIKNIQDRLEDLKKELGVIPNRKSQKITKKRVTWDELTSLSQLQLFVEGSVSGLIIWQEQVRFSL